MKFKTFSIVAGSEACNARCPFCVSRMTPPQGISLKEPQVNWRNFRIAALLAKQSGADTAMITGKGEPTLFPGQVTKYLEALHEFEFPFIELQTNGIALAENKAKYIPLLKEWYNLGLTMIAISIVHYDSKKNRTIYSPHKKNYIDLPKLIGDLHGFGLSVRLTCILINGYIDSASELEKLVSFSKQNGVEQLTIRPVNKPEVSINPSVYNWTSKNHLKEDQLKEIQEFLDTKGTKLLELPHSGVVYDLDSQNVCLTNSLTRDPNPDNSRQLIFFPDGHIRYDWEKEGAILL